MLPSVLLLSELLFSLPFSSGTVERMFLVLKLVKTVIFMHLLAMIYLISALKGLLSPISLLMKQLTYGGRDAALADV